MLVIYAISAVCLLPPVEGPVVARYAPVGQYGGHWGLDLAAPHGAAVRAPATGVVTFAGSVAGMATVSIEPVEGFKVSVSYLARIDVAVGQRVVRGQPVALAGSPHGRPGVHLSTRVGGRYIDPAPRLACAPTDITRALRLVTPPRPYPRSRAHRDPRGDVRSDPHRPSPRRPDRTAPAGAGPRPDHARRRSLAEE